MTLSDKPDYKDEIYNHLYAIWSGDLDKGEFEYRCREVTALLSQVERDSRLSELEMFKKIEVMDMSKPVAEHISRRTKQLQSLEPGRE